VLTWLRQKNPGVENLVSFLKDCRSVEALWFPSVDKTKVVISFSHALVDGSIYSQERFVDPMGFFF